MTQGSQPLEDLCPRRRALLPRTLGGYRMGDPQMTPGYGAHAKFHKRRDTLLQASEGKG
jgi:hypothetical protein